MAELGTAGRAKLSGRHFYVEYKNNTIKLFKKLARNKAKIALITTFKSVRNAQKRLNFLDLGAIKPSYATDWPRDKTSTTPH